LKRPKPIDLNQSDYDINLNSPDHKSSKTDRHLLHNILKINDNMDKQSLKLEKDSEDKEPGFA
jgi:hypothetical protein